jgi:hypothetical protein
VVDPAPAETWCVSYRIRDVLDALIAETTVCVPIQENCRSFGAPSPPEPGDRTLDGGAWTPAATATGTMAAPSEVPAQRRPGRSYWCSWYGAERPMRAETTSPNCGCEVERLTPLCQKARGGLLSSR